MKTYDMRFDAETMAMLQNLKGSVLKSIRSDAEALPFADASVDVVVSSSCFEHIEFFWLMFNEGPLVAFVDGMVSNQ